MGFAQKLQYIFYAFYVIFWVLFFRPQLVYASDLLISPAALFLKKVLRLRLVYHEHDSPDSRRKKFFTQICFLARNSLARSADISILPNRERLRIFIESTGRTKESFCVWNCPLGATVRAGGNREIKRNGFSIFYAGTINRERLPKSIIESMTRLPEQAKLEIVGYETIGSRGYIDSLRGYSQSLGLGERTVFLNAEHPRKIDERCYANDLGLALIPLESSDINVKYMIGASNKAFQYLACGVPVLVSNLPDWEEMFVKPGFGSSCDPQDPRDIARAINWFIEHPGQAKEMGERGRRKILEDWNYERQFEPVLRFLEGEI